jgi:hypothetical protein
MVVHLFFATSSLFNNRASELVVQLMMCNNINSALTNWTSNTPSITEFSRLLDLPKVQHTPSLSLPPTLLVRVSEQLCHAHHVLIPAHL